MCGIVGFVGKEEAAPILLDGLRRLEYRGYDSAGIAVFSEKHGLQVSKTKGRLQALAEIEEREELLTGKVCTAPDGERWTLRKLLRRFLWHDRIHARAMWRTAAPLWGSAVADPFGFR